MEHDELSVDHTEIGIYPLRQFLFGFDPYAFEHLLGHLAEKRFDNVRPRGVLRRKDEL